MRLLQGPHQGTQLSLEVLHPSGLTKGACKTPQALTQTAPPPAKGVPEGGREALRGGVAWARLPEGLRLLGRGLYGGKWGLPEHR